MIRSIGEVAKVKLSVLYTQMIIHGSFSRFGIYCAMKGRITKIMPKTMKIMPITVKGWKLFIVFPLAL
ncbi:MAG: hypothetical protein NWF10_00835 [Candidatus Bathyarchaeota archaeon]|jgi:hypothetical protein|nr:hypothetical protein [Candidatus Bathyarchaeota archaeon]